MRYFFHVLDNGARSPDEVGVLLADDASARIEAARFLADLAREMIQQESGRTCDVEIVDVRGRQIAAIGFSLREGPETMGETQGATKGETKES